MCFQITSGPTVTPATIKAPRSVTVRIKLRSATPATATVTCDPQGLGPVQTRTVSLGPIGKDVTFTVQVGDVGPGAYPIVVRVEQDGCGPVEQEVHVVMLIPEPAVKS